MEEAAAAGEAISDYWISSTNWIVAGGSLDDSISFETSETLAADDDEGAKPRGLMLRPPSEDPPPCEITICFRDRHEIYRVYVRSTARVYEIYYACDQQNKNREYLCTVRCGVVATMEQPSFSEEGTSGCPGGNKETSELPEHMVRSDSNYGDEDGWIQVKVLDTPLQDDVTNSLSERFDGNAWPKMQVHYEATAEISDANPFFSLTLRLLSLHNKEYVHVEEIYLYADPAAPTSPDPPAYMGEKLGGSSLSAMLVPGLLQFLKSGNSKAKDKCSSDESEMPKDHGGEKIAQVVRTDMGRANELGLFSMADQKLGPMQKPSEAKPETAQCLSSQKLSDPGKLQKSIDDERNLPSSRVEKVLDELVSRVGRIEALCSRFEENMMKPLACIDMRLQRLEQQLDGLTVGTPPAEHNPYSRMWAPSFVDSCSENKDCNAFQGISSPADEAVTSTPKSQNCRGLTVKAPDFVCEDDSENRSCNDLPTAIVEEKPEDTTCDISSSSSQVIASNCPGLTVKVPDFVSEDDSESKSFNDLHMAAIKDTVVMGDTTSHDISSSRDQVVSSTPESQICSDMKVKEPEFSNENYECAKTGDTIDSSVKGCTRDNKSTSIDSALASVLATFMTSCAAKSSKPNLTVMDTPGESSSGINSSLFLPTVEAPSEGSHDYYKKSFVEDNAYDLLQAERKGTLCGAALLGEQVLTQDILHCTGVEPNRNIKQTFPAGGWTDEEDDNDEVVRKGLGLNQLDDDWSDDSSSTSSSFDENFMKSKYQFELSYGGSSKDSLEGAYTINQCNWQASAAATSAASNCGSAQASAGDCTTGHFDFMTGSYQSDSAHASDVDSTVGRIESTKDSIYSDAGSGQEKKNMEFEWAVNSMLYSEDVISTVKFSQDKDWISGLPLEVLLGEMPGGKIQNSGNEFDYGGGIAARNQDTSHVPGDDDEDRRVIAVDLPYWVVQDLPFAMKEASVDGILLPDPAGSSDSQVQHSAPIFNGKDFIAVGGQPNSPLPEGEGTVREATLTVNPLLLELDDVFLLPGEETSGMEDGVLQQVPPSHSKPQQLSSLVWK